MQPAVPRTKTPTLVHVARLAGVGVGTASRAMNEGNFITKATAARVFEAAEQLGYRRNEVARSLKVRRTGAIGIVVPGLGGPFMGECIRAALGTLREHEYISVLTLTDDNLEAEGREIEYLLRRQIDGLIVVPARGKSDHFQPHLLRDTPVVAFDQPIPGAKLDEVLVENKAGAVGAVEHLLSHGHTRIACVAVNSHLYTIKKRIEGYREAMKAAGLEPEVFFVNPVSEDASILVAQWLNMDKPPTAVFSANELASIELLPALAEHQIPIPDRMAFVGFDDLEMGSLLRPALTVVVQPAAQLGLHAASLLLERIESPLTGERKRILLPTELVIRQSCGCA